jgi:hypothetical protein
MAVQVVGLAVVVDVVECMWLIARPDVVPKYGQVHVSGSSKQTTKRRRRDEQQINARRRHKLTLVASKALGVPISGSAPASNNSFTHCSSFLNTTPAKML